MLGQPSVIARLMGLEDAIVPATPTPAVPAAVMIQAEEDSMVNLLKPSSKLKQFKCSSLPHHGRISREYYRYCLNKMKPRRRSPRRSSSSSSSRGHHRRDHDRHPQEELLEKIKEEFRASWQQASMRPTPEDDNSSGRMSSADRAGWVDGRYIQRVAQENLRREKMARFANGKTKVVEEEEDVETVVVASVKAEEADQQQQQGGSEVASSKDAETEERFVEEGTSSDSHRAESEEFLGSLGAVVNADPEHDQMSSASENSRGTPTRIAILRPIGTTLAAGDNREPGFGTPPPSWKATRDGGMEEFLRAVKERLDNEMKAKTGASDVAPPTTRRLWGSDDPELAARDTAKRIREAASMAKEDLGRRLSRLESFRVFRGDRSRRDAAASLSPEHRMLKRVRARIDAIAMSPKKTRLSGSSSPVSGRGGWARSSPPADASLSGIGSDDDDKEEGEGMSCGRGDRQRLMTRLWKAHGAARMDPYTGTGTDVVVSPTPSPRALVRSFSAPASSGISSGGEVKLSRSRSFSLLRGTVASGISLGGKLLTMTMMHLSKKKSLTTTMDCSAPPQDSRHLMTAAQGDFLAGLAPPSPVSPLEVHGRSPRHFAESSPRRSPKCSSEFETSVVGGESPWRWKIDAAEERDDDPDKMYVRELLVAAGLFDDNEDGGGESWEDTAGGSTDSMAGPMIMSDDVFYEVEDAYYYGRFRRRVEEDGAGEEEEEDGWQDRRRLLFDLANEALETLQTIPPSSLSLRRWIVVSSSPPSLRLRGSDLEDEVWRRVARAMTGDDAPPAPATMVDGMVEREVGRLPWMALREDVCAVGRKVERAIFDELLGEVLRQVFVRT